MRAPTGRSWRRFARPSGWAVLVPIVVLLAGALFAVTSSTARGTDLRTDREEITEVIFDRVDAIESLEEQRKLLAADVEELTTILAAQDERITAIDQQNQAAAPYAGLTALTGPGVQVTLTDAPLGPDGQLPPGAGGDDVIIHQSDVQGILNAMWAADVDGIMIQGQRIIGTTAVRCVGNTLLLRGKTYSPPFVIVAIGDQKAIQQALVNTPGVELFLDAVKAFGLGYDVKLLDEVTLPAYDGPLGISYADAVRD